MESVPVVKKEPGKVKDIISLTKGRQGQHYKVVSIAGGGDVQTRLASLGILPGQKIRMVQPSNFGPVMITVKGSKLALGRGVGFKIMVQPISA